MKYANLHLHSTYSDGGFTPEQLVHIGKALGYRALALTDHENDAGVRRFYQKSKAEGLDCVAGVEFYGKDNGVTYHLVALDYDMDHPGFRTFLNHRRDAYTEWTRKIVERGIALGILTDFSWNDVLDVSEPDAWICANQLFLAMQKKGLLSLFDAKEEKRFRELLIKAPEVRAMKTPQPSAEEVIRVTREAGGVAILAHPSTDDVIGSVGRLVEYGLNGIEVSHPDLMMRYSSMAIEAANTYHLYRSGGTDHTGPMSDCGGNLAIPVFHGVTEEEYYDLKERRLS